MSRRSRGERMPVMGGMEDSSLERLYRRLLISLALPAGSLIDM